MFKESHVLNATVNLLSKEFKNILMFVKVDKKK